MTSLRTFRRHRCLRLSVLNVSLIAVLCLVWSTNASSSNNLVENFIKPTKSGGASEIRRRRGAETEDQPLTDVAETNDRVGAAATFMYSQLLSSLQSWDGQSNEEVPPKDASTLESSASANYFGTTHLSSDFASGRPFAEYSLDGPDSTPILVSPPVELRQPADSDASSMTNDTDDCHPERKSVHQQDVNVTSHGGTQSSSFLDEVTVSPLAMTSTPQDLHAPSSESQVQTERSHLAAGAIAGIAVASVAFAATIVAALGFALFRRMRGVNKSYEGSKFANDNCSYLDSLQVSYINNHIDIPKETSDEMLSLDNDSFLNSLEAMTMENYWAEESRNTRV